MSRGPNREFTRSDVIATMRTRGDSREPWTSNEVATELGCSRDIAYNRLRELNELGSVRTKKVSSRGRVWWLSPGEV